MYNVVMFYGFLILNGNYYLLLTDQKISLIVQFFKYKIGNLLTTHTLTKYSITV